MKKYGTDMQKNRKDYIIYEYERWGRKNKLMCKYGYKTN